MGSDCITHTLSVMSKLTLALFCLAAVFLTVSAEPKPKRFAPLLKYEQKTKCSFDQVFACGDEIGNAWNDCWNADDIQDCINGVLGASDCVECVCDVLGWLGLMDC